MDLTPNIKQKMIKDDRLILKLVFVVVGILISFVFYKGLAHASTFEEDFNSDNYNIGLLDGQLSSIGNPWIGRGFFGNAARINDFIPIEGDQSVRLRDNENGFSSDFGVSLIDTQIPTWNVGQDIVFSARMDNTGVEGLSFLLCTTISNCLNNIFDITFAPNGNIVHKYNSSTTTLGTWSNAQAGTVRLSLISASTISVSVNGGSITNIPTNGLTFSAMAIMGFSEDIPSPTAAGFFDNMFIETPPPPPLSGMFQFESGMTTGVLANLSSQLADPGTLSVMAVLTGLALFFFVVEAILNFFPGRKKEKEKL